MEDNFNEKLNLDDLYKQKKLTEEHKIKIYQRVLARVHSKIKTTSRTYFKKTNMKFRMPGKLDLDLWAAFFQRNFQALQD